MELWRIIFIIFLLMSVFFTKMTLNYIVGSTRLVTSMIASPRGKLAPMIKDGEEGNNLILWMFRIFSLVFLAVIFYDYWLNR